MTIERNVAPGASSQALHDLLQTKGFDLYRQSNGSKWIVTGGPRHHGFEAFVLTAFVPDLDLQCEPKACDMYFAQRTEKPFGDGSRWKHEYRVAWLAKGDAIKDISAENQAFFYPLK